MKLFVLASAALAAVAAAPAAGSVMTVSGSHARLCYTAAESRQTSVDAELACDIALANEALTPFDVMATHVNRGIIRMLRGERDTALADFNQALALDSKEPEAWLNKGVVTFDEGKLTEASQLASRALALGTKKPALALYIQAVAKENAGDVKSAYADLVRASQLEPTWALPKQELARYQVRQR